MKMRCRGLKTVSILAFMATGALSSWEKFDITEEVRHNLERGFLFPRVAQNLQAFPGALGGAQAPPISESSDPERPYEVDGDTFPDFETAAQRSCDNQKNSCAEIANSQNNKKRDGVEGVRENGSGSGSGSGDKSKRQAGAEAGTFEVGDCDQQNDDCKDFQTSATQTAFQALVSSNADFDFFCDV